MELIQWSMRPENVINKIDVSSPFSDMDQETFLLKVYQKFVNDRKLDEDYYNKIAAFLFHACIAGFGGDKDYFQYGSPQAQTIAAIRTNIYIFSAAKEFQQVKIMSEFINEKGVQSSFSEFKKKASVVFDEFNNNYLKTEYDTAIGQSQMARDWVEFEANKQTFPYLTYHTQRDGRVREHHAILDGVCRKVGDSFWNYNMPKNGWNCRCFVTSHDKAQETKHVPKVEWGTNDFPEVFKMNPGKDKLVFKKDHPYFKVSRKDKAFRNENFGLPLP